ncbi:MAG TPA: glycosyltransferase family 2 protein [Verrucomicrobiae bacterium]|jgi:dolichol-phosphate mannosyltransferase|nr:glycosyltransferase family 2 protein [Verrucomicrobiae bacterium]
MPKVSIIIPCFNEEAVLPELFVRLDKAAAGWNLDYEILCVDDGSRDRTWELLKTQNRKDPRWRCVSFARNFGHQTAVSAGLFYAKGDAVVVIDADLQDPPEQLIRFFEKWREGFQVVYAVRQKRKENAAKRFCYWAFYRLMARMTPFHVPLDAGDFCLMDRCVVDIINQMPERNRFVRGMRAWTGFQQIGIPYERDARAAGEPKYTVGKLLHLAWDGVSSFSSAPLRLATYLGFWVSGFAFLGVIFTFIQKMFANQFTRIGLAPNPGFPTIVISVLFLGGVQLICLGILGEYVGRIYDELKRRPLWVVRETAGVEFSLAPGSLNK